MKFDSHELDILEKAIKYYSIFYPFGEDLRHVILEKLKIMKTCVNLSSNEDND